MSLISCIFRATLTVIEFQVADEPPLRGGESQKPTPVISMPYGEPRDELLGRNRSLSPLLPRRTQTLFPGGILVEILRIEIRPAAFEPIFVFKRSDDLR